PEQSQMVRHPGDRLLIARDGPRRENDKIALPEPEIRVFTFRDAGKRRARLALAAGAQHQHLVRLEIGELVLIEVLEVLGQVAGFDGYLNDAVHGTPSDHKVSPSSLGGLGNGTYAGDVGREGGYSHPALCFGNDGLERLGDFGLGG